MRRLEDNRKCFALLRFRIEGGGTFCIAINMAQNVQVCEIHPDLVKEMKQFKFRKEKNVAAIVMKIDKESLTVVKDDTVEFDEDMSVEDLQSELPSHQPRYVLLSYVHKTGDGRVLYPFIFIFISPAGCKAELSMMYSGSQQALVKAADATRVLEVRSLEDLTEDFIKEKLPK